MFAIDDPTAVAVMPTPEAAGTPGYFTEGNPALGQAATYVRSSWLNALQQELLNVLAGAGISPSKTAYDQLLTGLRSNALTMGNATGAANTYAVVYTPAITALVDGMVLWFKASAANTGASTLAINGIAAKPIVGGAHSALQGGEITANGKCMVVWNATLNSFVLIECTGAALQVGAATQSQHAMQLGQATGRLLRTTIYVRDAGGVQNVSVDGGAFTTVGATAFTKLSLTTYAIMEVTGGGGASGGNPVTSGSQAAVSSGGGGGATGIRYENGPMSALAITVGAAGALGGPGGAGGNGGTSSVGALISAPGGQGSPAGVAFSGTTNGGVTPGGAAPTGANMLALQGGPGGQAVASGTVYVGSQQGGSSGIGIPNGYGSGAPGKYNGLGTASPQNGNPPPASGIIIIREYA